MIHHSKPCLGAEEKRACLETLESHQIAQGPKVAQFETEFGRLLEMPAGVATSSGTAALHLALLGLGIGKGDEVILPTYVCAALLNAIHFVGAVPKVVDIEPNFFNIDPVQVRQKRTRKTKAMIVPHMFGFPADLNPLLDLEIPIIEDCAQTVLAKYDGKLTGTFGILSIFSFYATKVMTTGEGGMILSSSKKLLRRIRDLRDYDNRKDYHLRFNYKMTDLQAAVGIAQMAKLPFFINRRREIASIYSREFSGLGFPFPEPTPVNQPIYYRFILKIKKTLGLIMKESEKNGVICGKPVDIPLHRYLKLDRTDYPQAEFAVRSALSIPIYPELNDDEVKQIVFVIKKILGN